VKVLKVTQGTAEWALARSGHVTSSRICDVMAKIKSGEAAARRDYRIQLVAERLTGKPSESGYTNAYMIRGTEQEPFARAAYEMRSDVMVDQVGFVLHEELEHCGCSPDGLVGDDGLLEIKCPKTSTHIGYILDGGIPSEYRLQMLWQMECTGRSWCDFLSYDPRLPENLQLFIRRYERNDERLAEIRKEVVRFNAEVEAVIKNLPFANMDTEEQLSASIVSINRKREGTLCGHSSAV